MKKTPYLPKSDQGKEAWLNNFASKFEAAATTLGFTVADVTTVKNYAAIFSWVLKMLVIFTTTKENWIKYKDIIRSGDIGSPIGITPVVPTLPDAPAGIVAGIFNIVSKIVQRIKASPNYTEAIGKDLGIIGAEQSFDPRQLKPIISGQQTPQGVDIDWFKGFADGINIYVDRRDNKGFVFLATDMKPNYIDTFNVQNFIDAQAKLRTKGEPIPGAEITLEQEPKVKSVIWDYYAIYVINDTEVGKPSDVISVMVTIK